LPWRSAVRPLLARPVRSGAPQGWERAERSPARVRLCLVCLRRFESLAYVASHLIGRDLAAEVPSAVTVGEHLVDRAFHRASLLWQTNGIEQRRHGADGPERVGNVLSGDIRGRAVNGLEQTWAVTQARAR